MQCTVLLFAQLAERIGQRELTISLDEHATVADAIERLAAAHAPIRELREQIAVAVDETYGDSATPLSEGCTIALIPPVSGG